MSNLLSFIPLLFSSRSLGIAISEDNIHLAELSFLFGHYRLIKYATYSKNTDWPLLINTQGFCKHRTILGISNTHILPHSLNISKQEKFQQTILIQSIEQQLAISHYSIEIASKITTSKEHHTIESLIIRKEVLSRLIMPLKEASFKIYAVEPLSFAITRYTHESKNNKHWAKLTHYLSKEDKDHFEQDKEILKSAIGLAMLPQHEKSALIFKTPFQKNNKKSHSIQIALFSIVFIISTTVLYFKLNLQKNIKAPAVYFKMPPSISRLPSIASFDYQKYSLKNIKHVGYLENIERKAGLIQTPDGIIHRVYIGDYLGKEYALIQEINETHIIISVQNRRVVL